MTATVFKDQMTPKERFNAVMEGKPYDRIPVNLNVGPHAAKVLGINTSEFGQSADRQVEGFIAAYKKYGVEALGPFLNIMEAIGVKYVYPENSTPYVAEPLVKEAADFNKLRLPDPRTAKEFQIFWEVLERLIARIGHEVPVEVGIVGPITAASGIRGIEPFLKDLYQNPELAHKLLQFVSDATISVIREAGKYGVRFVIYDPTASGSLIHQKMYRQFALPYERQLIEAMKQAGNAYPTLHICGKTTNIWSDMADTGAPILSLDNIVDLEAAKHEVGHRVVLMGNVKPTATMLQGTPADVDADVKECLAKAGDSPKGYLMALGCGLPLNTPPENIIALVEANRKYGQRAVLQG